MSTRISDLFIWLFFQLKFIVSRVQCVICGCETHYDSRFNMPDDWHSPTWCGRCLAVDDTYGIETTSWPFIYSCESVVAKLKYWLGLEED